jgi:hypothetical protein
MPVVVEDVPKHEQYFDEDMEPLAPTTIPEADETNTVLDYDKNILAAKVHGNSRRDVEEGNLIGRTNQQNPILDTALYEEEFKDDRVEAFHANQITDSIYARVDDDGYTVFEVEGTAGLGWGWGSW